MENDSGEEKHEEMQVSNLLSVMTATRSSHTSGSVIVGEAHRPASMGERWFQLEQEGKGALGRRLMTWGTLLLMDVNSRAQWTCFGSRVEVGRGHKA